MEVIYGVNTSYLKSKVEGSDLLTEWDYSSLHPEVYSVVKKLVGYGVELDKDQPYIHNLFNLVSFIFHKGSKPKTLLLPENYSHPYIVKPLVELCLEDDNDIELIYTNDYEWLNELGKSLPLSSFYGSYLNHEKKYVIASLNKEGVKNNLSQWRGLGDLFFNNEPCMYSSGPYGDGRFL